MAFEITDNVQQIIDSGQIKPNLVLEIDGVTKKYGAILIKKYVRIGDTDLEIGDPDSNPDAFYIGGFNLIDDQSDIITLSGGTTTQIRQTLKQDKGTGEDISSMQIALVDIENEATLLITPDTTQSPVFDLMGRRCKVYLGFDNTAWKDDYIVIFRGLIDNLISSGSGIVIINLIHPDSKKRTDFFIKSDSDLSASITDSDTTISVDDASQFLVPVLGPSGVNDTTLKHYIKIGDEIIQYAGITGNSFTGCTRGSLSTTAVSHLINDNCESIYELSGNVIDLALKLMMSGVNGSYKSNIDVGNFVRISPTTLISNSVFFSQLDVQLEYNVQVGDYITTTGASNGANNVTLKQITGLTVLENGDSYIEVTGVTFVEENDSAAILSFRSQYDALGEGLGMLPEEVDIDEHLKVQSLFLSSFNYQFILDDSITGKEFLSEQIYNPASCYSIPRKARSSIGYHIPPIPSAKVTILNEDNVKNASRLMLQRSTSKNFFNSIIYKYNKVLGEDKYSKSTVTINTDSLDRIPVGNKPLTIESLGLRASLDAENLANQATARRLKKYKFGAELLKGLKTQYATGYKMEIGDIALVNIASLKVTDIASGTRTGEDRLFEIVNKALNIQNGDVSFDLVDTSFDKDIRYCLISPSSFIKSGASTTVFTIKESYSSPHGVNEYLKWSDYIGTGVIIHNEDFSISDTSTIQSIAGNEITLSSALSFTPTADMIFEMSNYDNQTDAVKLLYGSMTNSATFSDGKPQYKML